MCRIFESCIASLMIEKTSGGRKEGLLTVSPSSPQTKALKIAFIYNEALLDSLSTISTKFFTRLAVA